jgi:pyruvate,water dikinase
MPEINPAHQLLKYPKSEIGLYALDVAQLAQQKIPLPITYCIPVSALKLIGQHNQLDNKFEDLRQKTDLKQETELLQAVKKIQKLILQQSFPKQVTDKLLEIYNHYLEKDFIRLTASPVVGFETNYKREDNIKGEANMMESILKLWARNVDPHDFKRGILYPIAIVIQAQFQPTSSGLAFSFNPKNGNKSEILIKSVFGVYAAPDSDNNHDEFRVDQRSWQIISQQITIKKRCLMRKLDGLKSQILNKNQHKKASLSSQQIKQLAKLVRKIKLQRVDQVKIHWSLVQDKIIITKIKPCYYTAPEQVSLSTNQYKTLLVGTGLNSGFVPGKCRLIKKLEDIKQVKPGEIAVIPQLTHEYMGLIQICSAFVCEQGISSPEILAQLRHYQLPTIIQAKHALNKLKNGQSIVVDANAGKVYKAKNIDKEVNSLTQSTKPRLLLAVNQFDDITEEMALISEGIGLFRSEHLFIQTGQHPLQLLQNQPQKFKQQVANQFVQFYHRYISLKQKEPQLIYRSFNLNSNQLAKLKGGSSREKTEINPFLGFRGAIRHLNQPHILNFELDLLKQINQQIDWGINLLLPFVRTPFELQQIQTHINSQLSQTVTAPQVWLEISTPENLINIEEYTTSLLAGVSINIKNVTALLHGFDPNYSDISAQYNMLNNPVLNRLITSAVQTIQKKNKNIQVILNLSEHNQDLIDLAIQLELDAVTVRPEIAKQVKRFLVEHN